MHNLDSEEEVIKNELLLDYHEIEKQRNEGKINFNFEDFLYKESSEQRY
jgi:hypothetical protein